MTMFVHLYKIVFHDNTDFWTKPSDSHCQETSVGCPYSFIINTKESISLDLKLGIFWENWEAKNVFKSMFLFFVNLVTLGGTRKYRKQCRGWGENWC